MSMNFLVATYSSISYRKFAFQCRLDIRQVAEGSHYVPGIVEAEVKNVGQVWEVLQAGSQARAVGSNNVNEHSSRSHWFV